MQTVPPSVEPNICDTPAMGDSTPRQQAAGSGVAAVRELSGSVPSNSSTSFSHAAAAQKAIVEAQKQLHAVLRHLVKVPGAAAEVSAVTAIESQSAKVAEAVTKLAGAQAALTGSQLVRVQLLDAGQGTARAVIELS